MTAVILGLAFACSASPSPAAPLFQVPFIPLECGGGPRSVACADLNGDGVMDLVASNYDAGTVSVFVGKGRGRFRPRIDYATGPNPNSFAVADLNGDRRVDIVVACAGSFGITILIGNGDGTFGARRDVQMESPRSLVIGDVNSDGHPDLAFVYGLFLSYPGVLLGAGDGAFAPPVASDGLATLKFRSHNVVALGDLNGDGRLDMVVEETESRSSRQSILVAWGNGRGAFSHGGEYFASGVAAITVADVNHDAKPDVITSGGRLIVLLNNGDGTLTATGFDCVGQAAVGDLNGDGYVDLVTSGVSTRLGDGSGSFGPQRAFQAGSSSYGVEIGDLNGDGRMDIVSANWADRCVDILPNNGDGTFGGRRYGRPDVVVGESDPVPPDAETPAGVSSDVWFVQVFPNPARGAVTFRFALPAPGKASLRVLDLTGRTVCTVVEGVLPAGEQFARWSGGPAWGRDAPPGVYVYELNAAGRRLTGRFAVLK